MGVAIVALVMSMTGGAIAATLITSSSQIKNGAVTGSDIKNGTIRSADIAPGTKRALKGGKSSGPGAGVTGMAGPAGPAGPAGATGPAGPAGAAVAFARVKADGTLDGANSKNVTSATPGSGTGRYCFKLSFTPKSTIATPEWSSGADGVTAQIPDQATIDLACPAGSRNAGVFVFNAAGAAVNNGFYVVFE